MAGKKISELDQATEVLAGALIELVQSGQSWRIDANLIANIVEGIGREALTVTAGPNLDLNNLAVFLIGTIKNAFATETELVAGNAPSSGLAGGADVTWVVFTFGNVDHITQMAFSPTNSVEKVKIRFRESNVWTAWSDIGGGGVDPALEQQVAENTARFLPDWQDNRNLDNFDFTGGFPVGLSDTDSVRVKGAPYVAAVFSQPPPSPVQYDLAIINIFPSFFAGIVAFELNVGWGDNASLCTIADNRIAIFNGTDLKIYRIDLDDVQPIAQIGNTYNGFTVGGSEFSSMAYIAENEFCFFDTDSNELVRLSFDGTDVTTVGNALSIAGATTRIRLAKLNATDIALGSQAENNLRLMRFDGSDWSIISALAVTYGGDFDLTSLNEADVLITTHADGEVNLYHLEDDSFSFLKLINTFASPAFITITDDAQGDGYITTREGASQFVGYDKINYNIANPDYSDREGAQVTNVPTFYMRGESPATSTAPTFTHYRLSNVTEMLNSNFFTMIGNNEVQYLGKRSFLGSFSSSLSLRANGNSGREYWFAILKNNDPNLSPEPKWVRHKLESLNSYDVIPLEFRDFQVNEGDIFSIYAIDNSGLGLDVNIESLDLNCEFKGWI